MDTNTQLTINSFRQLFPDKIFSRTFPWLLVKSPTFPGFPDKWSPWNKPYSVIAYTNYHKTHWVEMRETNHGCCGKPTPAVTLRRCYMQSGWLGVSRSNSEHRRSTAARDRPAPWRSTSSSDREAQARSAAIYKPIAVSFLLPIPHKRMGCFYY